MKRLRGQLQMHKFILGRRWAYMASVIGLLIGIATVGAAPPVTAVGIAVAIVSMGLALATLVHDARALAARSRSLHQVNLGPKAVGGLSPSDRYREYEQLNIDSHYVLTSSAVDDALRVTSAPLTVAAEPFALSLSEQETAAFVLREHFRSGAILFNDRKVRLVTDLSSQKLRSDEPVTIQKTDYFSSLCTNEIACREIRYAGRSEPLLRGRDLISSNQVLSDLEFSRCSNHIGVSTIAITSDGSLVVTTQAAQSAQSPNLLTASGSGSVDWADLNAAQPMLRSVIEAASTRELCEEVGLGDPASAPVRTQLLGYARVVNRGGKPEFFSVSHIDAPVRDLRVTRKEAFFIADIGAHRVDRSAAAPFAEALIRFESKHAGSCSLSLTLGLRFLRRYLASDPANAVAFITGDEQTGGHHEQGGHRS